MLYIVLKSLHVLAVVLFLGNIITGLFWKRHADRTGDPRLMAHALDGVIRSDRWFTMPGVLAIIVTGVGLAQSAGYPIFATGWIWKSLILFGDLRRPLRHLGRAAPEAPANPRRRRIGEWPDRSAALPEALLALGDRRRHRDADADRRAVPDGGEEGVSAFSLEG